MEGITPVGDFDILEPPRMELRGIVALAGEVIARYWPMRTFVHHNPFHSLEYLNFDETVRRGRKFLGVRAISPATSTVDTCGPAEYSFVISMRHYGRWLMSSPSSLARAASRAGRFCAPVSRMDWARPQRSRWVPCRITGRMKTS